MREGIKISDFVRSMVKCLVVQSNDMLWTFSIAIMNTYFRVFVHESAAIPVYKPLFSCGWRKFVSIKILKKHSNE